MFEQHFYVEGNFMGSVVRPHVVVHAERQAPYSYAYFCPTCGEVWARCPVTTLDGETIKYQVQGGYCRQHPGSPFTVPGSLMLAWEPEFNSVFPNSVVEWEFNRHIDYWSSHDQRSKTAFD